MGVRIDAFAVDVHAFARVLAGPLWRVLLDVTQAPHDGDVMFNVIRPREGGRRGAWYMVSLDRRVVRREGDAPFETLDDDQLRADPVLQVTAHEHLAAAGSSTALAFLLRDAPTFDGTRYAWEITSGNRRWWIGSMLAEAQRLWDSSAAYTELSRFMSRMLRGSNCGFPVEPHDVRPTPDEFPVVPDDDADDRMAVFDERDSRRFGELMQLLAHNAPRFGPPPDCRIYRNDDMGWHGWVHSMVLQLAVLAKLDVPNMKLVTFIG